jgi:hypothetical protein
VQGLAPHLIADGFDDFWMAMAHVENAEAAQAVQVGAAGNVAIGVRSGVGPFNDGACAAGVGRFSILEEAGIDVRSERLDGFARDPLCLLLRDLAILDEL